MKRVTFANRLDPDQARQAVGPDLDPISLELRRYSWKNSSKKLILKKNQEGDDKKKAQEISQNAKSKWPLCGNSLRTESLYKTC